MEVLHKKWFPSQAPAQPKQAVEKQWGTVYYKHVKDTPVHGGRIILTIIGKTKEEAEEIAKSICYLHNGNLKA